MPILRHLTFITCLAGLLIGCSSKGGATSQNTHADNVKLKQYMVQGKKLYEAYCSNCHQSDGAGFAKLYPPLAASDYLLNNLPAAACIIKNGMEGELQVNGVVYNQMMPANQNLTPLEVAEILTYISNSWGNQAGMSNARDVGIWLNRCQK